MDYLYKDDGLPTPLSSLSKEEKDFLWRGEKIMAIKSLRHRTGNGLAECKDFVEEFLRNHPTLDE